MICFFKQKTADEMRISDWSSDVCSSDLTAGCGERAGDADADAAAPAGLRLNLSNKTGYGADGGGVVAARRGKAPAGEGRPVRAERRRLYLGAAQIHPDPHDFPAGLSIHRCAEAGALSPKQIGRAHV